MKTTDPSVLSGWDMSDSMGFYPEDILKNGFCLVNGEDVALFEKVSSGVYTGHYFFQSKGREALRSADILLSEFFSEYSVIVGLTPVENKKALWFTRQLKFKMLDVLETDLGLMQLSMLTKKEYE